VAAAAHDEGREADLLQRLLVNGDGGEAAQEHDEVARPQRPAALRRVPSGRDAGDGAARIDQLAHAPGYGAGFGAADGVRAAVGRNRQQVDRGDRLWIERPTGSERLVGRGVLIPESLEEAIDEGEDLGPRAEVDGERQAPRRLRI